MKLFRNFLYNVGYQVLIIIVPIILAPYLSRVVGPEGIGTYSYTYSIVTLFGLLANLGIAKYGNREIAKCGNDRQKRSQVFAELISIKFFCGLVTLGIYLCFVTFFVSEYRTAFYIQTLNLLSFIIEVSWLFWGMQEFRITTLACTVMKILSLFLVFAFVRSEADIYRYIFILASNAFLIHLSTWLFIKKYIDFKVVLVSVLNRHWRNMLLLFFPVLAKYLYSTMDRVMLGSFVGIEEVGYYENVQSITMTFVYVLTAMGDVILPKMTLLYETKDVKQRETLFQGIFHLICFLSVGGMYGFIGVADRFIPWFYGEKFSVCVPLLKLMSPILVFAGFSDLVRSIFLLPQYRDKEYVIALIVGAVVNFFINVTLIPHLYSVGAVIGTIAAEAMVFVIQFWFIRNEIHKKYFFKNIGVYGILGLLILPVCQAISNLCDSAFISIVGEIIVGGGLYTISVCLYLFVYERDIYIKLQQIIAEKKRTKNNA